LCRIGPAPEQQRNDYQRVNHPRRGRRAALVESLRATIYRPIQATTHKEMLGGKDKGTFLFSCFQTAFDIQQMLPVRKENYNDVNSVT
jgi:hypothetical protein